MGTVLIAVACLATHLVCASIGGVWNSDEMLMGQEVTNGLWKLILGQMSWLSVAFYSLLAALGISLLPLGKKRAKLSLERWPNYLMLALVTFAVLSVLLSESSTLGAFGQFRYPPMSKIVYGVLALVHYLQVPEGRVINCLLTIAAAWFVLLTARLMGCSRLLSLTAFGLYLFSFVIFYWSSFSYVTGLISLLTNAATYIGFCWIKSRRTEKLLWAAVLFAAAIMVRETAFVGALVFFLLCALCAEVKERNRTLHWRPLISFFLIIIVPTQLWLKYLVGSWFAWVGRIYPLSTLYFLFDQYDRWRAYPYVFITSTGSIFLILGLVGLIVGLLQRGPNRLYSKILFCSILAEYFFVMVFARMHEYDGHGRFAIPFLYPLVIFATLALGFIARSFTWMTWSRLNLIRAEALVTAAAFIFVISTTPYWLEKMPCTPAFDLSPAIQSNGNDQGFFPTDMVAHRLEKLPDGDKMVIYTRFGIVNAIGATLNDCDSDPSKSYFINYIRQNHTRYLVTLISPRRMCNEKFWSPRISGRCPAILEPIDPENFVSSAQEIGFRLVDTLHFNEFDIPILEVTPEVVAYLEVKEKLRISSIETKHPIE
jgi:hypothetical protein